MNPKKSPKANLENKKFLFLQTGFVSALVFMIIAFEWSGKAPGAEKFIPGKIIETIEELPPILPEKIIQKPPAPPEIIIIHEDPVDLPTDFDFPSVEVTPGTFIPPVNFGNPVETVDPKDDPFEKVEDMPTFLGQHHNAFSRWINQNLRYPQRALEAHIQGTVYISFIVNRDGSVSDIEILRGVHPSLDEETLRVIAMSPKWEPGRQWGKPVRVRFVFPVRFVVR